MRNGNYMRARVYIYTIHFFLRRRIISIRREAASFPWPAFDRSAKHTHTSEVYIWIQCRKKKSLPNSIGGAVALSYTPEREEAEVEATGEKTEIRAYVYLMRGSPRKDWCRAIAQSAGPRNKHGIIIERGARDTYI